MRKCAKYSELFTKFGGHPMAAGLSLPQENVEPFRQKINEYASLTDDDLVPKNTYRCADAGGLCINETGV